MALFLGPENYPSVRRVIEVGLDTTTLPDEVIADPVFQGAAEAEVVELDPDAADRTGEELDRVRDAAIYLTAARIVPALPQIIGERFFDWGETRKPIDTGALVAELRGRAHAILRDLVGTPRMKTPGLTLARGRRGA